MPNISEKLKTWRDSYINIAMNSKNNMLHQNPEKSSAIRLMTSKVFSYTMYWKIAMGEGDADDYALKSDANNDPMHRPIEWEPLQKTDGQDKLFYLNKLANTCYDTIAKKGENPLCITFGRLHWKAHKPGNGQHASAMVEIDTPVLLIPIKLNRQGVNYWLKPADDDAMVNPALLLKYQADGNRDFPIPSCGQWLDSSFDIQEYFRALESRFGEDNNDFSFDKDYVSLDLFDYEKLCMYRDVSRNMDEIVKNPIIRGIFGEAPMAPAITPKGLDKISPKQSCSILDSNSSQSDVIEHFCAGESFILEGPPGTGKTQTIVNMIAEALKASKKVLFVSGKMSALTTVKKKMKMHGTSIDDHCLLVQGEGENKEVSLSDIYAKLSSAYHARSCAFDIGKYDENAKTLENCRSALLRYNKEFYSSDNTLKMSLYDIIGRMLSLGYDENTVPSSVISLDDVADLDRERLEALTVPMRDIETLICSIFERFGSVENDVWYGLREDEFNYGAEVAVKAGIAEIRKHKTGLDSALARISQGDEKLIGSVVDLLFSHSIEAILNLLKLDPTDDLEWIYLKNSLKEEKSLIAAEAEVLDQYREEREHFRSRTDITGVSFDGITFDEPENPLWETLSVKSLSEELSRARRVKQLELGATLSTIDPDPEVISKISTGVDDLLESVKKNAEIRERLSCFTDEIFTFEHESLLKKFRTDWQEHLKNEGKLPLFYNAMIKKLKRLCSDAINTDFGMRSVYRVLEDLDLYHLNEKSIAHTRDMLAGHGIVYNDGLEAQLAVLGDYLRDYKTELISHSFSSVLMGIPSFSVYLDKKISSLTCIVELAQKLKLKDPSVTLGELRRLLADYNVLAIYNKRITDNEKLALICPSIPKNVFTDWRSIGELLELIEDVRNRISDGNSDLNENFTLFVNTISMLTEAGLCNYVERLLSSYNAFYGNAEWFDPEVMGDSHFRSTLTYADITRWLDDVSNADVLSQYVSFKKKVKALDPVSRAFFDFYAKEGRREYPINKLGNNYEIALLYAYYSYIVSSSDVVAKLSGSSGTTTIEGVIGKFAEADEASIMWNRKMLNNILVDSISHSSSPSGNIHTYLASVPSGRSASVRRLFANRHESILELAPCIMMSVYSVSKLLDFNKYKFDVVIFDEASQIPEEDALTSIMRTTSQLIITGDPKQMPAFNYFKESDGSKDILWGDEDETDDNCSSILDFVINIQNTRLGYHKLNMHYRSNHESLIKYSNEHPSLYGGNLITFPSPRARTRDFGLWDYCLPDMEEYRGVKITGGYGENATEVELMMKLIREHFEKYPVPTTDADAEAYEKSLGIIVFGEKQAKLLQTELQRSEDPILKQVAGITDCRIFSITPVDKIQGDEMDEMILSLTYGRGSDGELSYAWGPLVKKDGTPIRKFNVAVTRARSNLKFLHSIRASEITNPTLSYVKDYLTMMENFTEASFISRSELNSEFVSALGAICESIVGADRVIYNYGESEKTYRVPISILNRDKTEVALGILCEVNRAKDGFSVREYTRSCPDILAAQHWDNLYSTYAIQWIRNYAYEKSNLVEKLKAVL